VILYDYTRHESAPDRRHFSKDIAATYKRMLTADMAEALRRSLMTLRNEEIRPAFPDTPMDECD
jgi:hypothetical protein